MLNSWRSTSRKTSRRPRFWARNWARQSPSRPRWPRRSLWPRALRSGRPCKCSRGSLRRGAWRGCRPR